MQSAPFSLSAHQRDGLFYLRIGGDFERASIGHVQSALAALRSEDLHRIVFDLRGVTFLDGSALTTILGADDRGRREGFEVVVVRPPAFGARLFALSRLGQQLRLVDHPWEAGAPDQQGEPVGSEGGEGALEVRKLPSDLLFTCVRCRCNPAVLEPGHAAGGHTLISPDGPVCRGCVTRQERIELGEAILRDLRRARPQDEAKVRAIQEALTELRYSEPTD